MKFVTLHETAKGQRLRGRPFIECPCDNDVGLQLSVDNACF